jgi:hypothetical protein
MTKRQPAASFEQAKNPARGPQFLQIVAKPERAAARGKPKAKHEPKLTRVAFRVSRLMEFCSERELQNQTGHSVYEWPLVIAKELIDNGLDACEEAEVPPEIQIVVEKDTIVVQDNRAAWTPRPSRRFSTTPSGCRAARRMSRRREARKAML